ncbi:MAG: helix-turn-helix domain-containing protein [Lachnospiraceae bacterium]
MDIGSVIKKYRKEIGLTQEEMANRLGVTTPAVNKWENGNSNPDIELLAPIARLLNISLDTLLSFQEKLTGVEVEEIIREMDIMFSKEGYEKTYEWAVKIVEKYPNCNILIWQVALMLDARRLTGECKDPDRYDDQINSWYEMALNDENEEIRHHAADSLFGFYLRKQNYTMAEKYLNYFSDYDPMKMVYRGRLYKEQGKSEEAYEMFENVLFSEYSTLNLAFSMMTRLALEENDTAYAKFLAEKSGTLSRVFDRGKYNEYVPMLDIVCAEKDDEGTYKVARQLLENVDSLYDFQKSKLYRHKKFKDSDGSYLPVIKEKLLEGFRTEEDLSFMKGYKPWEKLIYRY